MLRTLGHLVLAVLIGAGVVGSDEPDGGQAAFAAELEEIASEESVKQARRRLPALLDERRWCTDPRHPAAQRRGRRSADGVPRMISA